MIRKIVVLALVFTSLVSSAEIFASLPTKFTITEEVRPQIDADNIQEEHAAAPVLNPDGSTPEVEDGNVERYVCRSVLRCGRYSCGWRRVCRFYGYSENEMPADGELSK